MGDRVKNIEGALEYLETRSDIKVVDTSFLYETQPMYVLDQPKFINGACLISTSMEPQALLDLLKDAEHWQGRRPTVRNGPRVVDLDILFDDNRVYESGKLPGRELKVPHSRIPEREFVLRPLADIIPTFRHPVLGSSVSDLLRALPSSASPMNRILNFPSSHDSIPPVIWALGSQSFIMATLNTTPDSFSDGGDHTDWDSILGYAQHAVKCGSSIIDIGGYSTRPGSSFVSVQEEQRRTAPFIAHLRQSGVHIPISVDTFRAEVALASLEAGANCINDVYALTGPHQGVAGVHSSHLSTDDIGVSVSDDGAMLSLAVRAKVPLILMHSRGLANQNKDYSSFKGGIIEGVRRELGLRVERALRAGVRRWNIILDPGIGFSKCVEDNVRLVRHHGLLTSETLVFNQFDRHLPLAPWPLLARFPTLVGTSRKGYLGTLLDREDAKREPKRRDWATAAAVTSLVQQGVDIVRVHAVEPMQDVVKVADAIWRHNLL